MSRIAKWKLEKTKVKVVFRLQFHATHIPQTGWDKLFISFIPSDSGKATAKTTKANVRNGTCKWADPIYETTRLLQDVKTKHYDEKLYKLVVAMGSSRSGILGEATINLAEYADASKPSDVSLPLHACNFGTVLHVTVQLLTSKTGFREFEQQRDLRERGLQSGVESKHDDSSPGKEIASVHLDKGNARVRFKDAKKPSSFEEEAGSHEECADSALGYDDSSNTSESLYAEKQDNSSTHEIESLRSTVSGDLDGLRCQSLQTEKVDLSDNAIIADGASNSAHRWRKDFSVDSDIASVFEENHKLRGSLELAESTIVELKQEISSLQSQANDIGIETQKFSHFLACEVSSSEEMAKEVSLMKSECLKLKDEIERLAKFQMKTQVTGEEDGHTHHHLLQDRQLRWSNGILSLENRIRVLQQKTYLGLHESDIRFIHSELEGLLKILEDIKLGTGEVKSVLEIMPSERTGIDEIRGICLSKNEQVSSGVPELDLDLSLPDSLLHNLSIPPLVSQETDPVGGIDLMKRKISDLTRELDEAKAGRDSLARKMDQMECYYEALIQELEENQKQMMGELQNLRNEHSNCVYTISASKAEMELMHQNMSQQLLQLAEESRDLHALNKELERRATTSEAALRRARLNYSIAVDKLQKDLELLSSQVVSMFETNENLIKQSFPESPQRKNRGYFQYPEDSEDASLVLCQNPNAGFRKQPLGGDILLEDLKKSLNLQEELYQKVEGELHEMQFVNLHLDIFSKTLQETLFEANAEIGHMKGNLDDLAQRLELSNVAQDQLIVRLQDAMEDIHLLNEYKASCTAKFSDMAMENHTLEAKLETVTKENSLLVEKVGDYEAISNESRNYQKKYEACCAENAELSNLLKRENAENVKLQNDISLLNEELKTSKAEVDELAFRKDNLHEDVSFVHDKLASMLTSYDQKFKGLNLLNNSHHLDLEANNIRSAVLQLEGMQHNLYNRMLELMEEKKTLDAERSFSENWLNSARSDIVAIKQKFRGDIQKMAAKVDASNALVGKIQFDLESVANKLELSSKVEEKYAQQNNDVLADFAVFEVELQKLTSENGLLSQEILGLEELAEELGSSKLTIADLMQESNKLASERDSLSENLRSLQSELQEERNSKEKLDDEVRDLNVQLNGMQEKLLEYDRQQSELVHFRQLSSDLESDNSRLNHLLSLNQKDSSCLNHLEAQLLEMDDYLLAADVKFTFILHQYETVHQEFVQRIKSSDGCLEELRERHQEVEAMLHQSLVSEARYKEENAELTRIIEPLQSDLEAAVVRSKFLSEENDVLRVQLEDYKTKFKALEDGYNKDRHHHVLQVEEIRDLLANAQEENIKLMSTVESLQSKLEASVTQNKFSSKENDAIRVQLEEYKKKLEVLEDGNNKDKDHHTLQVEEIRNLLADAKEENIKLMRTVESLQSDLEASVSQNKFFSKANDATRVQLEEYKKKLEALEDDYNKDKDHHFLQVEQLRNSLANAEEENLKLMSTIESLQSDLEASVSQNKFSSKANDAIRVQLEEYKKKLEALEDDFNKDKDHHFLQVERLRNSLANAEEENLKLMSTVESLQSDLEASFAQNKSALEANDDIRVQLEEYKKKLEAMEDAYDKDKDHNAVQLEQLRSMLASAEEENSKLARTVKSLQSDLEASAAQNTFSSETSDDFRLQLEEYKKKFETLEDGYNKDKDHLALQVEQLRNSLTAAEVENGFLISSMEELDITLVVLKGKLDEQSAGTGLIKEYKDEIVALQSKCNELARKLSEQALKTDEFKNLSIHLKELKDKAEAECLQTREKREPGGSPVVQESLRIAFIKEQYETKVQELRQQLSISKKHGEELLFKFQDAIDDIENRKRSEALHLKRNEELSLKLGEMEADLHSALSGKCEIISECDRLKAELECAVLTLECCKEEKEKLEASLRECQVENNKIAIELTRAKGDLENVASPTEIHKEENGGGMKNARHVSDESTASPLPHLLNKEKRHVLSIQDGDCKDSSAVSNGQADQEAASEGSRGLDDDALGRTLRATDEKPLELSKAHFNKNNFRSSMEHLHEELERMKHENSLLPMDPQNEPDLQVLQADLIRLKNANEELRNIFPLFDEISSGGNALERVLALEIELAESLRAKSKSIVHFQSSFLKQHSDEEAVLKSFRDINELIKEMLDLKGRYAAVETELKEMHDRYSQLSLQFAEVEGERQKLKMTLKNVRATKKLQLNRSSSAAIADQSP